MTQMRWHRTGDERKQCCSYVMRESDVSELCDLMVYQKFLQSLFHGAYLHSCASQCFSTVVIWHIQ